jgi:hypothetical protein
VISDSLSGVPRKQTKTGIVAHELFHESRQTNLGRRVAPEELLRCLFPDSLPTKEPGVFSDHLYVLVEMRESWLCDELEELTATCLGNQSSEPHGERFSTIQLEPTGSPSRSSSEPPKDVAGRIVRSSCSGPEGLQTLSDVEIELGDRSKIVESQSIGDLAFRLLDGHRFPLSHVAAPATPAGNRRISP